MEFLELDDDSIVAVFHYLDIRSHSNLRKTCKRMKELGTHHVPVNIERQLQRKLVALEYQNHSDWLIVDSFILSLLYHTISMCQYINEASTQAKDVSEMAAMAFENDVRDARMKSLAIENDVGDAQMKSLVIDNDVEDAQMECLFIDNDVEDAQMKSLTIDNYVEDAQIVRKFLAVDDVESAKGKELVLRKLLIKCLEQDDLPFYDLVRYFTKLSSFEFQHVHHWYSFVSNKECTLILSTGENVVWIVNFCLGSSPSLLEWKVFKDRETGDFEITGNARLFRQLIGNFFEIRTKSVFKDADDQFYREITLEILYALGIKPWKDHIHLAKLEVPYLTRDIVKSIRSIQAMNAFVEENRAYIDGKNRWLISKRKCVFREILHRQVIYSSDKSPLFNELIHNLTYYFNLCWRSGFIETLIDLTPRFYQSRKEFINAGGIVIKYQALVDVLFHNISIKKGQKSRMKIYTVNLGRHRMKFSIKKRETVFFADIVLDDNADDVISFPFMKSYFETEFIPEDLRRVLDIFEEFVKHTFPVEEQKKIPKITLKFLCLLCRSFFIEPQRQRHRFKNI